MVELPVGYYLANFQTILQFVEQQYFDILNDQEKEFLKSFYSLNEDAKKLYVRLISRVGPYFLKEKLNYDEINLELAISSLALNQFISIQELENLNLALDLLTKIDLMDVFRLPSSFKNSKKAALIDEIFILEDSQIELKLKSYFTFLRLKKQEIAINFKLLFFGNTEQDLGHFILEDVGILHYENYLLDKSNRFFKDREILDLTLQLNFLQKKLASLKEKDDIFGMEELFNELKSIHRNEEFLVINISKILNQLGQYFEKNELSLKALTCYQHSILPPARERQVRILDSLGDFSSAYELCLLMEKNPIDDSEREFLRSFFEKLKIKLGLEVEQTPKETFNQKDIQISRSSQIRIEEQVLLNIQNNGFDGFYLENIIWNGVFGLFFWDVIFASVPGAFFHPFQKGPVDLFEAHFFIRRKILIEEKLRFYKEKTTQELIDYFQQTFDLKFKTANHFVNWKKLDKDHLNHFLKRIPKNVLFKILAKMIEEPSNLTSGFPDLFLYVPGNEVFLLSEVKGPGDQLRPTQKRWLRFFKENHIPYVVTNVDWAKNY